MRRGEEGGYLGLRTVLSSQLSLSRSTDEDLKKMIPESFVKQLGKSVLHPSQIQYPNV